MLVKQEHHSGYGIKSASHSDSKPVGRRLVIAGCMVFWILAVAYFIG